VLGLKGSGIGVRGFVWATHGSHGGKTSLLGGSDGCWSDVRRKQGREMYSTALGSAAHRSGELDPFAAGGMSVVGLGQRQAGRVSIAEAHR
jgi:hypothetical protein